MKGRLLAASAATLALAAGLALTACSGGSHATPPLSSNAPAQQSPGGVSAQQITDAMGSGPAPASNVRKTECFLGICGGLSHYNLDLNHIAVAGVSSGAMMAGQFHYAFSSHVKYEAQFAGGPYNCALNNLANATNCMLGIFPEPLNLLEATAKSYASSGLIDSTSNLAGSKGYFFSGKNDLVVSTNTVKAAEQDLKDFGGTTIDNYTTQAGHTWPSPNGRNACAYTGPDWIDNCGIDPEQTFLSEFFGSLNAKSSTPRGQLIQFDQNRYSPILGWAPNINMDTTGWVFVPSDCASGSSCKLVVVFTGCLASQIYIGNDLENYGNVDNWADTNHMVVLYPQLNVGWGSCWDWYGYTGVNYAVKSGPQMTAVWNMVQAL